MSVIAQTELKTVVVSTIRLDNPITNLMDNFLDDFLDVEDRPAGPVAGKPYETLVFPLDSWQGHAPLLEIDGRRYDTEDEARAGHDEIVTVWTQKENKEVF